MCSFVLTMTGRAPATRTAGSADDVATYECSLSGCAPSAIKPLLRISLAADPARAEIAWGDCNDQVVGLEGRGAGRRTKV